MTRLHLAMLTSSLALVGCDESAAASASSTQATDDAARLDAMQTELEAQAQALAALSARADDQAATTKQLLARIGSLEQDLEAAVMGEVDLDGYATEAWVEARGYADADDLEQDAAAVDARFEAVEGEVFDLAVDVHAIEDELLAMQTGERSVDALMQYVQVDAANHAVVISGANLYVQSGADSTAASPNGLGNLVIGYDEADASDEKSGSHNLVVGAYHSYLSYGGLLVGQDLATEARYAVAAGRGHVVAGAYGAALGGANHTVEGDHAAALAGEAHMLTGDYSAALGGASHSVSGEFAVAAGGEAHDVRGASAAAMGGAENRLDGERATAVGGALHELSDDGTAVGGYANEVTGSYATAVGGRENEALGSVSVATGGYQTLAEGYGTHAAGGYGTRVSENYTTDW